MITAPFLFFAVLIVICVTIALCGAAIDNENLAMTGVFFLLLVVLQIASWSHGAKWQREDTLERYNLTPKTGTP